MSVLYYMYRCYRVPALNNRSSLSLHDHTSFKYIVISMCNKNRYSWFHFTRRRLVQSKVIWKNTTLERIVRAISEAISCTDSTKCNVRSEHVRCIRFHYTELDAHDFLQCYVNVLIHLIIYWKHNSRMFRPMNRSPTVRKSRRKAQAQHLRYAVRRSMFRHLHLRILAVYCRLRILYSIFSPLWTQNLDGYCCCSGLLVVFSWFEASCALFIACYVVIRWRWVISWHEKILRNKQLVTLNSNNSRCYFRIFSITCCPVACNCIIAYPCS